MKRILIIILALPLILGYIALHAQCTPQISRHLDINQVDALYQNGGDMFWDLNSNPGYEVPAGSGNHSNFASSLWIGGLDQSGQLHMAAQTYRQSGIDYFSGPYSSTSQYNCAYQIYIPEPVRENGTVTLSNGKVLFLYQDGYSVYDDAANSLDDFTLTDPHLEHKAVELADGKVLIFGDISYPTPIDPVILDSGTYVATSINTANFFHKNSTGTLLSNGTVLVSGLLGSEIFDPSNNTFSSNISQPTQNKNRHTSILLSNGNVMRFGGAATYASPVGDVNTDIYDPVANSWTTGPVMATQRIRPALQDLGGGKILIVGGTSSSNIIEQYDESNGTITPLFNLPTPFLNCTTMLLNTGEIAILGSDSPGQSTMYIYDPVANNLSASSFPNILTEYPNSSLLPSGEVFFQNGFKEFAKWDLATETMVWNEFQKIWKVSQSQIDQFIADHANGTINWVQYPDIQTWPAHGDPALGQDFILAPFIDLNNDGFYTPNDGEYPCIQGDQSLYWIFNDDVTNHTETGADKMGLQMKFSAYAYDCPTGTCPDDALDFTTLNHVEIVNKSSNTYTDVYLALWTDSDIGFYADDYVGCDSTLDLAYAYNGSAMDIDYGIPPAQGTVILSTPQDLGMTNFMYYENDFTVLGNPETAAHYYGYMQSRWKDGSQVVENGSDGWIMTAPGRPTNFMYTGDPAGCNGADPGWNMISAGLNPFDRRYLQSAGPFTFEAGDTIQFDWANIWSLDSTNLASVCKLKQDAADIKAWWDMQNYGCFNLTVDREDALEPSFSELTVYPNPNAGNFYLQLTEPLKTAADIVLMDAQGRTVYTDVLPAGATEVLVDQPALSQGLYIVRVYNQELDAVRKLIVE